jgi:phosphoserine phosphatase RsbU/P
MATPLRVLFIEDSDDDAILQVRLLRQGGYDVSYERVETPAALSEALEKRGTLLFRITRCLNSREPTL